MSALAAYGAAELAPTAMDIGVAIGKHLGAAAIGQVSAYANKPRTTKKKSSMGKKPKKAPNMGRVGSRVGGASAKWDTLSTGYTNMSPQTLQQLPLLNIIKATTPAYDRRLRDQLNFRGIKFCMNFRCEGALGTAKSFMNVAVISPKSDLLSTDSIPNASFFRDPNGTRRDIAFGDLALTSLDYYCNSINTDKYNIHKRMKMEVGPTQSTEGRKEKYVEFYLPVVRQIRYNENDPSPDGKNLYLVWWFSASDGGTPANSMRFSYRVTRYFKETVGL